MKRLTAVFFALMFILTPINAAALTVTERMELLAEFPELEVFDNSPLYDELPVAGLSAPDLGVPSALLMEKETGNIIFSLNEREARPPASVTKVMTMLIIMEALDGGIIKIEDKVPVSAYAQNMGGSQVYMHEGEEYTVRDMLKSIVIASGNDASVAMAEYLAGSEETFVGRMNDRAAELGMSDTVFKNCNGLPQEGHVTSARDIAIMSRELLLKHPSVRDYTTIWMDSLREGTFTLSNTNKLVRFYQGATGLKTGSTSVAKFCLSASAERDGMELIAVIMGADNSDIRFAAARKLLDFGFANYQLTSAYPDEVPKPIPVVLGTAVEVAPEIAERSRILVEKLQVKNLERVVNIAESLTAPVVKGQKLGDVTVKYEGQILAEIPIVAAEDVPRLTYWQILGNMIKQFMMK
ncbi:MAG: D-alanyl-D-alanine carboxypeptidase [Oscillospiraceae bacterium]|nr:D-alanyl-D-alanine carboxypeptidase [Oscillospiraceae bacterium]